MPFEYENVGSGITPRVRRRIAKPLGVEEQRALLGLLSAKARLNTFEGRVEFAEAWAREVLGAADPAPDDAERPRDYEPYRDPEWFAAELLGLIGQARALLREGATELFGCVMFELGVLATEAAQKFTWEKFAEHGMNNRRWLREAHEAVHGSDEEKAERWREQVAAYETCRAAGMGKTEAMEKAAKKCGVCTRTIQRARNRSAQG